jgi:hypothetical protein
VAIEKLAARGGGDGGWGIAFLVSAGIVAEIVAKACSSPQTTELNADTRAPTLMKWVNIGMAEAAVFVFAAAVFDRRHRIPILLGGITEAVITYGEYLHGKAAGLKSTAPPTERAYAPAGNSRGG